MSKFSSATLIRLDEASRADHIFLTATDRCAFLAQCCAGGGYRGRRCNELIRNFKCEPTLARRDARRGHDKREAISTMAQWLRAAIPQRWAESCTWVPIPPSRQAEDQDFDDRLSCTLHLAFSDYDVDVRRLLRQTRSTVRDHARRVRLSEKALFDILSVDQGLLAERAVRGRIVLFDDLLTSGKHFRCCERRLHEQLPALAIAGVFLMRRAPAPGARSLGRAW